MILAQEKKDYCLERKREKEITVKKWWLYLGSLRGLKVVKSGSEGSPGKWECVA